MRPWIFCSCVRKSSMTASDSGACALRSHQFSGGISCGLTHLTGGCAAPGPSPQHRKRGIHQHDSDREGQIKDENRASVVQRKVVADEDLVDVPEAGTYEEDAPGGRAGGDPQCFCTTRAMA